MARSRYSLGPLLGYHGCDYSTAEKVLTGQDHLKPSQNDYDWLGPGIYFWVDSPERAFAWGKERGFSVPYVVGAYILPGLCLNLTDYGVNQELKARYSDLKMMSEASKQPLPQNVSPQLGISLRRFLDCAVFQTLHRERELRGEEPYDTVYGVFEEGGELYPGSGFKEKTHVQIALRNTDCIQGYFRVPEERFLQP